MMVAARQAGLIQMRLKYRRSLGNVCGKTQINEQEEVFAPSAPDVNRKLSQKLTWTTGKVPVTPVIQHISRF